jgi:hypothetical protein
MMAQSPAVVNSAIATLRGRRMNNSVPVVVLRVTQVRSGVAAIRNLTGTGHYYTDMVPQVSVSSI